MKSKHGPDRFREMTSREGVDRSLVCWASESERRVVVAESGWSFFHQRMAASLCAGSDVCEVYVRLCVQ